MFSAEGMQITLTDAFTEASVDGFTVGYGTNEVAVLALKESFSLAEGLEEYTLSEYGRLVLENNGLESYAELQNYDGLTYFEYQSVNPETEEEYYYFSVIYKSSDAFWLIQFASSEETADNHMDDFLKWAKSVQFSSSAL